MAFLEGTEQPLATSAIPVAALCAGVRDGEERQRLNALVAAFVVLALDRQPAQRGGLWRRLNGPSHGTTLVTLIRRHVPMLADVLVPCAKG